MWLAGPLRGQPAAPRRLAQRTSHRHPAPSRPPPARPELLKLLRSSSSWRGEKTKDTFWQKCSNRADSKYLACADHQRPGNSEPGTTSPNKATLSSHLCKGQPGAAHACTHTDTQGTARTWKLEPSGLPGREDRSCVTCTGQGPEAQAQRGPACLLSRGTAHRPRTPCRPLPQQRRQP